MQLKAVRVRNFRCIEDATLHLDDLTQIVGPNGSGKSTFLAALQWFYDGPSTPNSEDFYNREDGRTIEIDVTYALESTAIPDALVPFVDTDGNLAVSLRVQMIDADDTTKVSPSPRIAWIGYRSSHPPFDVIRALTKKPDRTVALRELLVSSGSGYDFIVDTAWDRSDVLMRIWERDHPESCIHSPDSGEFFQAPNNGGPLSDLTSLVSIPALHDASGESEATQRNLIGRLAALAVGDPMDSDAMRDLADDVNQRLLTAIRQEGDARLPSLQERLGATLKRYVPGVGIRLGYRSQPLVFPRPTLSVQITDRGFEGDLEGKGHGLQRLYIVSLIEVAANVHVNGEDEAGEEQPRKHQLLTIEEPELYQHPIQARRFAKVLRMLSDAGTERRLQVAYSTHSPLFIDPARLTSLRLCRAERIYADKAAVTIVRQLDIDAVVDRLQAAGDETESADRLQAGLIATMTTGIREGFFADSAVLLEGDEDEALLRAGVALVDEATGPDIEFKADGLAVLSVGGKDKLHRVCAVLEELGIACFVVFDGDFRPEPSEPNAKETKRREADQQRNIRLLTLVGAEKRVGYPSTTIESSFAVFHVNLQETVRSEADGDAGDGTYIQKRNQVAEDLGWEAPSRAEKNVEVVSQTIQGLAGSGCTHKTLRNLASSVIEFAKAKRSAL